MTEENENDFIDFVNVVYCSASKKVGDKDEVMTMSSEKSKNSALWSQEKNPKNPHFTIGV